MEPLTITPFSEAYSMNNAKNEPYGCGVNY